MALVNKGFSLTELMIVCAIIVALVSHTVISYSSFTAKKNEVLQRREATLIRSALDGFARRYGRYPLSLKEITDSRLLSLESEGRWIDRWSLLRKEDGQIFDVHPRQVKGQGL